MMLMIEIKSPFDQTVRQRYRLQESVQLLHDQIQASNLAKFCISQSFDHEALRALERVNQVFLQTEAPVYKLNTLYLQNFYYYYAAPPIE